MKKKIIALFLACVMCVSVLVMPVNAFLITEDIPEDFSHFVNNVVDDWNIYKHGNISKTEFFKKFMDRANNELAPNICADLLGVKDLLRFLEKCGVDVSEQWEAYYSDHMGGNGSGGNRDDSLLNGYGAVCQHFSNGELSDTLHCAYGIIHKQWGNQIVGYSDGDVTCRRVFVNGKIFTDTPAVMGYLGQDDINTFVFYGDWRYDGGDKANDIITELPEKIPPKFDDDSIPEEDLEKFLDRLFEKLQLQFPDLSTLEGLMRAILAKLGTLDSDDDGQLLAEINTAIITLASDNHSDNQTIITLLTELKESLKKGSATDLSKVEDKLSKIQKSLDYLCTINTIDTGVDLWKQLTETEKAFLSEYAALITTLLPKFGLTTINNVIMNINSVLLNNTPPSDLTADVFGERVTILSSDMFDGEAMQYIDLAKTFISVLLIYSFCLIFRRKIVGGGA